MADCLPLATCRRPSPCPSSPVVSRSRVPIASHPISPLAHMLCCMPWLLHVHTCLPVRLPLSVPPPACITAACPAGAPHTRRAMLNQVLVLAWRGVPRRLFAPNPGRARQCSAVQCSAANRAARNPNSLIVAHLLLALPRHATPSFWPLARCLPCFLHRAAPRRSSTSCDVVHPATPLHYRLPPAPRRFGTFCSTPHPMHPIPAIARASRARLCIMSFSSATRRRVKYIPAMPCRSITNSARHRTATATAAAATGPRTLSLHCHPHATTHCHWSCVFRSAAGLGI